MDPVGYKRWDIRFIFPSEGAMKEQELKNMDLFDSIMSNAKSVN